MAKKSAKKAGLKQKKGAAAPPQEVSVPERASCLSFLFLLAAVVTVWIVFWWDPNNVPWRHAMSWPRIVTELVLVLVIPILIFRALSLWMMGDKSRFPDIDRAWNAGLEALAAHGFNLRSAPLFIIHGAGTETLHQRLMDATQHKFRIHGVPKGPAPLHWYANARGIYLVLADVSWLDAVVTRADAMQREAGALAREQAAPAEPPAAAQPVFVPGTVVPAEPATPQPPVAPASQPQSTLALDKFVSAGETPVAAAEPSRPADASDLGFAGDLGAAVQLTSLESTRQTRRLEHVCQLLWNQRHPVCPVNGILTLLPFGLLQSSGQNELERAVAADLGTMHRALQVRCPVTALVTGMEEERGFRELVRRVGRDRAQNQRFGQRFDVRISPTVEEMRSFAPHVCGSFEDWVYTLFREEEALTHPGNTRLYGLLCKVRSTLKSRLQDVLATGFGVSSKAARTLPIFFSGCYFAATGARADRQAFVRGVIGKLVEEQEDVEWAPAAVSGNRWSLLLSLLGWAVGVTFVVWMVVSLVRDHSA